MGLKIDERANDMKKLYDKVVLKSKTLSLDVYKQNLKDKQINIEKFIHILSNINQGSISRDVVENLIFISNEFKELYDNFDDKLMIFIVGDGNVGKSTLLNALVGKEVAKTNFLPTTWKIDVYSPELSKDKAIIKYTTGKQETLSVEKAKQKINQEDEKIKESKKIFNKKLNEKLKGIKNKEKIKEIKRYLGKEYIYKSNICEVRWPVKSKFLLEECLLVDTPGLNQDFDGLEQIGSAYNYYHKADGVVWLLDGNKISSQSPNILLKKLNDSLKNVGGVRDNIIGVINRIDLLRKNGGQEAVDKVYNDSVKHFGNKFTKIIPLSATDAYKGISNNDNNMIEQSGIEDLRKAIEQIFLSKADTVKGKAKEQGSNRLIKSTKSILNNYKKKIDDYNKMYISKEANLKSSKENLINSIKEELSILISNYLDEVNNRVEIYVDQLSNGEGIDFIKNTIYKVNEFESTRNSFIKNKKLEIKNNTDTWEKLCKISEYKYIQPETIENYFSINVSINFNNIDTSSFFTPSAQGTLISSLGNLIGKIGFLLRRNRIKQNLMMTIRTQCEDMEKQLISEIESIINQNYENCIKILNVTFKDVLFDFNEIENVRLSISNLEKDIDKTPTEHTFEEIVGISGKDEYLKNKEKRLRKRYMINSENKDLYVHKNTKNKLDTMLDKIDEDLQYLKNFNDNLKKITENKINDWLNGEFFRDEKNTLLACKNRDELYSFCKQYTEQEYIKKIINTQYSKMRKYIMDEWEIHIEQLFIAGKLDIPENKNTLQETLDDEIAVEAEGLGFGRYVVWFGAAYQYSQVEEVVKEIKGIVKNDILPDVVERLNEYSDYCYEFISEIINEILSKCNISRYIKGLEIELMDFKESYDNFDDKLMILIIGDGNAGKSTLLNALVGKDVAKTSFLPTTWKIDVYSSQLSKDNAIIKYIGGNQEILSVEKAKQKVNQEEEKMKESKNIFNKKLNEELKGIKNKEKIKETKMRLGKEYVYKSNICEVRWPVKSKFLLEECLLVDTPGLNQDFYGLEQIVTVDNYYHKADGVIWLLDANKISSQSPNTLLKELDDTLKNVGGVRDNIIGVINRIDLLRKKRGQEAVDKVYNDAVKYFGNKFTEIIPISATEACEGISNKDNNMIEQSGILDLKREIEHIFLLKANKVNEKSKKKG